MWHMHCILQEWAMTKEAQGRGCYCYLQYLLPVVIALLFLMVGLPYGSCTFMGSVRGWLHYYS